MEQDEQPADYNDEDIMLQNIEKLSDKIESLQKAAIAASERGDPDTLSMLLMRIAYVNSALGKHGAKAQYIARNADRAARRHRANKTLGYAQGMAVNKSELQAELDSEKQFMTASEAQLIADEASDLCYRTDTFLKMSQSRLSLIKNDAIRG